MADSQTERLCYLATQVLSLDDGGHPVSQHDVWGRVFVQLSTQVDCVKAAAAAFGAAYESSLANNVISGSCSAWRYYGAALARLQSDFDSETVGPEALTLASMTLASVEILSQHEQNAWAHFLGAVQILTEADQRREEGRASSNDILSTIKEGLAKVNLLVGCYGLSRTPQHMYLQLEETTAGENPFLEAEPAISAAMTCLQRSYTFIELAAQLRYTYPSWKEHDPVMCERQSDAVARCQSVLYGLGALATRLHAQYSTTTATTRDSETLAEIYAMRTQLTSTMIFILCVHSPYETAYDEHQELFRTIVSDAAASARLRHRTRPSAFKRFSTRPGIITPLFLVIMKCRDPSLRSIATALLGEQTCREGPADGQILAAIGARMASIESSASVPSRPGAPLAASDILEEARVYGYEVPNPRLNDEGRRVVDILFNQPNPPLAQGWGSVDYSRQDSWMRSTETIEI